MNINIGVKEIFVGIVISLILWGANQIFTQGKELSANSVALTQMQNSIDKLQATLDKNSTNNSDSSQRVRQALQTMLPHLDLPDGVQGNVAGMISNINLQTDKTQPRTMTAEEQRKIQNIIENFSGKTVITPNKTSIEKAPKPETK